MTWKSINELKILLPKVSQKLKIVAFFSFTDYIGASPQLLQLVAKSLIACNDGIAFNGLYFYFRNTCSYGFNSMHSNESHDKSVFSNAIYLVSHAFLRSSRDIYLKSMYRERIFEKPSSKVLNKNGLTSPSVTNAERNWTILVSSDANVNPTNTIWKVNIWTGKKQVISQKLLVLHHQRFVRRAFEVWKCSIERRLMSRKELTPLDSLHFFVELILLFVYKMFSY